MHGDWNLCLSARTELAGPMQSCFECDYHVSIYYAGYTTVLHFNKMCNKVQKMQRVNTFFFRHFNSICFGWYCIMVQISRATCAFHATSIRWTSCAVTCLKINRIWQSFNVESRCGVFLTVESKAPELKQWQAAWAKRASNRKPRAKFAPSDSPWERPVSTQGLCFARIISGEK